jgi:hypothetical protein
MSFIAKVVFDSPLFRQALAATPEMRLRLEDIRTPSGEPQRFLFRAAGTGLGVNIVRSIAGTHGWWVHVEESDEGGARFVVADAGVAVPAE